jgi:hypothetical protein
MSDVGTHWQGQNAIKSRRLTGLFSYACLADIVRGIVRPEQVDSILIPKEFADADLFVAHVQALLGSTGNELDRAILALARDFYNQGKTKVQSVTSVNGGFWAYADGAEKNFHFNVTRNMDNYPAADMP